MNIQLPSDLAVRLREAAGADPPPIGECSGRGIVICAGGTRLFTCAWLLIAMLRRTLNCRLPIEVWHIGPTEMGPPMRALLEAFEVRVIDALNVLRRHPVETLGGWQLKTYALMHSDFREILLLDADNMPITDPAFLFDAAAYTEAGSLFWPDIVRLKASNPIWEISGLPRDAGASFETGQILIDKQRRWRALTFANWINQNHLAFDDMLYGDKDAFYIAWRMLGDPYHLIEHAPKLLEHTMVQRSPRGDSLFQHRNGAKWMLNGPNPRIEGFRFEAECFMLLAELRQLWDGAVFNPPARSAAARAVERDLVASGRFRLVWVGSHEHVVTLCPQHLVRGGVADTGRCWFVADGIDGLELRLIAGGILVCALRRDADAVWRGTAGGFAVELQPEVPGFALGMNTAATGSSDALLAVADRLLDSAGTVSESDEIVVTLATLAGLDPALAAYLESRTAGPSNAAALAFAAIKKYRSVSHPSEPLRTGTGWLARPDLGQQSEAVLKR